MTDYEQVKKRLSRGWNTWNTRSVLSHVRLPDGFALNLCLKEYTNGAYLKEALIGRRGEHEERIHPGPHAYDGSYTELRLSWRGIEIRVQSAVDGDDLVLLVTPFRNQKTPAVLVLEAGLLWNRPGTLRREDESLIASLPNQNIRVFSTSASQFEPNVMTQGPYLALPLTQAIGISTGTQRTREHIEQIIGKCEGQHATRSQCWNSAKPMYHAVQSVMAWDTIYDPANDRVVSPVSRIWNIDNGGYALFCWDTYFAALMASLDNRDLAYANAIEITREKTSAGFVPNAIWGSGYKSLDRSQPPVGSWVVRTLYRRYGDKWLLEELFDDLLTWNRWWVGHRDTDGLLCWGSEPYEPRYDNYWETAGVNQTFGGALESGLDNSPMYDEIPFDGETHRMCLADAGLNGLYVWDCDALADIAQILGRGTEEAELRQRAESYRASLKTLWGESSGIFLNRRTDTGVFSSRLSPTNFYPLLGQAATQSQAERMVQEHFYNPKEFWGEWILPSISRNDPAYPDQTYWRGRIWAPMNFLVYLGLSNYDLPQAKKDLAEKSRNLLLKEWLEKGHIHENYSGDTGEGCDKPNSDAFYHWGALLGLIALMEDGYLLEQYEVRLEEA